MLCAIISLVSLINKLTLGGFIMKTMDDLVNEIVMDIEEIPADPAVTYEVWAIGHDEEDRVTDAEMLLGIFEDPDQAVAFAKETSLADVVNLAADDDCEIPHDVHSISIEVETVVPDDEGNMNIGTIYHKTIELFEELPEYITLSNDEYEVIEETGNIQIPRSILKEYNKNDEIAVIFEDEEQPWPITFKIIYKTDDYYICEFV
jgi:hypothetical protein